jgi:hypothetical protein
MKKIILLWFLFFGMYPTINNNTITFSTTYLCYSQSGNGTGCPDPSDPVVRTSIWEWLGKLWKAISGVASSIYDFLDDFFGTSGGNNSPPSSNNSTTAPDLPITWAVTFYGSATSTPQNPVFSGGGYSANPAVQNILNEEFPEPDPPVTDCEGILNGTAFIDDCNRCVGGYTGLLPCYIPPDCNGVVGGTAYRDSCNRCVGGNTGLTPCKKDCNGVWGGTAYVDSCQECVGGNTGLISLGCKQPIILPCDTIELNNSVELTNILDSIERFPEMKKLRDSVNALNEQFLSIYDTNNQVKVCCAGMGGNASASAVVFLPDKRIIATTHTHNGGFPGPSITDFYSTIFANKINHYFRTSFVISSLNVELALQVTDTMKSRLFYDKYKQDSLFNSSWPIDTIPGEQNSIYDEVNKINEYLFAKARTNVSSNYSVMLSDTYSLLYVLNKYNTGIKLYMKKNGRFRQLKIDLLEYDSENRISNFTVSLCD